MRGKPQGQFCSVFCSKSTRYFRTSHCAVARPTTRGDEGLCHMCSVRIRFRSLAGATETSSMLRRPKLQTPEHGPPRQAHIIQDAGAVVAPLRYSDYVGTNCGWCNIDSDNSIMANADCHECAGDLTPSTPQPPPPQHHPLRKQLRQLRCGRRRERRGVQQRVLGVLCVC
jgi:hypothetical protein